MYSDQVAYKLMGSIIIGLWCIVVGIYAIIQTYGKGELVSPVIGARIHRYRLNNWQFFDLGYLRAFVYTALIGPGQLLAGIFILSQLLITIWIRNTGTI